MTVNGYRKSNQMNKLKPFPIILTLFLSISCSLFAKPINMIYLIPEGYTGGVLIFYDDEIGITPEELEDGTILYRIPTNGVLIVKSLKRGGPYKLSYFFIDNKDTRTEIEYLDSKNNAKDRGNIKPRNQDEVTDNERDNGFFAMNHRSITFSISNRKISMHAFSVGHPKDSTALYTDAIDKADQIEKDISKKKLDFEVRIQ